MNSLTVNLHPLIELADEQFYQLCLNNRDLKFERTADGEFLIMLPTGGETGRRNIKISAQLEVWSSQNSLGVALLFPGKGRSLFLQGGAIAPVPASL